MVGAAEVVESLRRVGESLAGSLTRRPDPLSTCLSSMRRLSSIQEVMVVDGSEPGIKGVLVVTDDHEDGFPMNPSASPAPWRFALNRLLRDLGESKSPVRYSSAVVTEETRDSYSHISQLLDALEF